MSNHFVLPGQKAWRALPDKCRCPPVPRPFFVFEKHPEQPDGGSDWASSRQAGTASLWRWEIRAETLRSDSFTEFSTVCSLNCGFLWLITRSGHCFSQFRVKLRMSAVQNLQACGGGGGSSKQLTVPPTHLWYIFPSGLQDVPVWLCMSACAVLAPDSADGAMRWRLSAIPSPLDCNTLSTMCRGPERPAICLLLLVQRWDISNHHLVDVYLARDTLSLVSAHILCPRSRCEKIQRWAPIDPIWR